MHKFEIDDPLEMSQKYGLMSLWGIIATGLFDRSKGFFSTGSVQQLGIQLAGAISILSIAAAVSSIMFYILKKRRRFRTGHIYQMIGFDEVLALKQNSMFDSFMSHGTLKAIEERQRLDEMTKKVYPRERDEDLSKI